MRNSWLFIFLLFSIICLAGCRKDPGLPGHEEEPLPSDSTLSGFYLLNEGNMGLNKASIDFYDRAAGEYKRNIYNEINPSATKELGDVGNDLQIYGSKMYAVINRSDKVEVMEASSCKRIGQINIVNCRYVCFSGGKAYVSSYAGKPGDSLAAEGFVAEVDTTTLEITRSVAVGRQPEEMAVVGNKLYVANSGGYSPSDYERTVSVVDLAEFKEIKRIDVAINLHLLKSDGLGHLYVTSRGDYYDIHSNVYLIDTNSDLVIDSLNVEATNLCMQGDTGYIISVAWNYLENKNIISYSRIDLKTQKVIPGAFITDDTEKSIAVPFGLAVDPQNGDIYLTDAQSYSTPGILYCFDKSGKQKWKVGTGDVPGHFAFIQ